MPQRGPVFGLLGPLLLSVDGTAVPIGTPKQRAVMASLVMNRNRPVAADSLINAVWGEDAPSEARASLHAYVSNLRRLLGTVGIDGKSMLEKVSPGYRLNIGELDVDLGRFIRARNEGVKAATAGRFDEASRHYSAALAQWRGDVLDDLRGFDFVSVVRHGDGRGQNRHPHRPRRIRDRVRARQENHRGAGTRSSPTIRSGSRPGSS